jgi:hypothetical protein
MAGRIAPRNAAMENLEITEKICAYMPFGESAD